MKMSSLSGQKVELDYTFLSQISSADILTVTSISKYSHYYFLNCLEKPT